MPSAAESTSIDRDAVRTLRDLARADVEQGRLPNCQWALAMDGEVVAGETLGAPDDSRFVVFSVTKAITAAAVWLLPELRADRPVAELTSGFDGGKSGVTVGHLLTHTAGFPRAPMRPDEGADQAARRARFASWRLDWAPGSRTEYHASAAHWVLADLVEAVTGADFREVVHTRLLAPLDLPGISIRADDRPVVEVSLVGAGGGPSPVPADARPVMDALLAFNSSAVRAAGVPGAGAVAGAADVALFYQAMLHDRVGLWDPQRLADGTTVVHNTLVDPWIGVPANRTLGLSVAGSDGFANLRQFGTATGPRAFGASGIGGQLAWADPDTGLSFCCLTGGLALDVVASFVRADRLATAAARCAT